MTSTTTSPAGVISTEPVRDFATDAATWIIRQTTAGEYLTRLGIYDPATGAVDRTKIPDSEYQRYRIQVSRNPIKKRMLRDVLRGGTLPTVVTVEGKDGYEIADGLQRTDVMALAAEGLAALERGEEPGKEVRAQLAEMDEAGQQRLPLDRFLEQPLTEQVWSNLRSDEKLRLFMLLNVGQQKVSPRHLLEVAARNLRETFEDWGIELFTEREEKDNPPRRGRPRKESSPTLTPASTHYRYELLIDCLMAYVTGDPHIKTRKLVETEGLSEMLSARITEVGSEACREDFVWVCLNLNERIQEAYEGNPKWETAARTSENFLVPLFAALGAARAAADTGTPIRRHEQELVEFLDQSSEDPLRLTEGPQSLDSIYAEIRSNIGRRQRAIAFFAWRRFFQTGPSSDEYPLNWQDAQIGS
jgi:hypothetical protein